MSSYGARAHPRDLVGFAPRIVSCFKSKLHYSIKLLNNQEVTIHLTNASAYYFGCIHSRLKNVKSLTCVTLLRHYLPGSMSFLKRGWLCKGAQTGSSLSKGIDNLPGRDNRNSICSTAASNRPTIT